MALSYDVAAQQRPRTQQISTTPAHPRVNPFQLLLAMLALLPAIVGVGVCIGAYQRGTDTSALLLWTIGTAALYAAASFGLLWVLVSAVTWQIKEHARTSHRG